MNVIGIGTDIVKVQRMKPFLERLSLRNKTFTECELSYALKQGDPLPFLAARFAVKESVLKVLKQGTILSLKDIEVIHDAWGAPEIKLTGYLKDIMESQGIECWMVTMSHEKEYAIAFVIGGKK